MALSQSVDRMGQASSSPVVHAAATSAAYSEATAPSAAQWVAILHRAHRGASARHAIRAAGYEVHWPRLVVRRPRQDDMLSPLFPGYLFARVEPAQSWGALCYCDDVLEVLGVRDQARPHVVPRGYVEALIDEAGSIDLPIDRTPEGRPIMRPGPVRLAGGPLDALQGLLVADGGSDRVKVLLSLLGRSIAVSAPRQHVRQA